MCSSEAGERVGVTGGFDQRSEWAVGRSGDTKTGGQVHPDSSGVDSARGGVWDPERRRSPAGEAEGCAEEPRVLHAPRGRILLGFFVFLSHLRVSCKRCFITPKDFYAPFPTTKVFSYNHNEIFKLGKYHTVTCSTCSISCVAPSCHHLLVFCNPEFLTLTLLFMTLGSCFEAYPAVCICLMV